MKVRPVFGIALVVIGAWGAQVTWARANRAARNVAWTTCPFFGAPVVRMLDDIPHYDTLVTRVHEEKHAEQCRQLGPMRYRLRSLTAAGKLSLEAPGFCAGAQGRLLVDADSQYVSDRLHTDMIEGLADILDSNSIKAALMRECPAIASQPRRTRGPPRKPATTPRSTTGTPQTPR